MGTGARSAVSVLASPPVFPREFLTLSHGEGREVLWSLPPLAFFRGRRLPGASLACPEVGHNGPAWPLCSTSCEDGPSVAL